MQAKVTFPYLQAQGRDTIVLITKEAILIVPHQYAGFSFHDYKGSVSSFHNHGPFHKFVWPFHVRKKKVFLLFKLDQTLN